jgi:N4-gp56 family major capsid protein
MTSEGWIDVNKYSNATAIFNGEIGKLYGVRFVETTEAQIDREEGDGKLAKYTTIFLDKGAYKVIKLDSNNLEVIVKGRGSAGAADPLNQRSTIGWKAIGFTAKVVIPEYIVAVESASHFSTTDAAN